MGNAIKSRMQLPTLMLATAVALTACVDITSTHTPSTDPRPRESVSALSCNASISSRSVSCDSGSGNLQANLIGGQNVYTKVTTSDVSYNSGTETFSFDVTVTNLLNETIGTPGVGVEGTGIMVFLTGGATVTAGSGTIEVTNPDGTATFSAPGQPYFQYDEILGKDQTTAAKTWQLHMPATVTSFAFNLLINADITPKLVINEVMANSSGSLYDTTGDYFELYNAGTLPIDLQDLVIADSAASGRRPYHLISSSVVVQPGAYVVLGQTTNTTSNGGVPVDYAFGGSIMLASSLDALKISRVIGDDTVTISRTQYANASVSVQDGVARELKNPALDNTNMDGSNWSSALVTAVYGAGGRGTPKAQNSTYTP